MYLHDEDQRREENDDVCKLERVEAYGATHAPKLQRKEDTQTDEAHDHQFCVKDNGGRVRSAQGGRKVIARGVAE